MTPIVRFKKLHQAAIIPAYQTSGSSGMDLHWDGRVGPLVVPKNEPALYSTGLAVEIPEGYEAQIRPRSSFNKNGCLSYFGTIDSDYRGQMFIALQDMRPDPDEHFFIGAGDRIAQLVIAPVARCVIQVAEELTPTERGGGGFGSTGR